MTLKRGMSLAAPSRFRATRRVDVKLRLLPGVRKLKNRALVHFHSGSFESMAEVTCSNAANFLLAHEFSRNCASDKAFWFLPGDPLHHPPVVAVGHHRRRRRYLIRSLAVREFAKFPRQEYSEDHRTRRPSRNSGALTERSLFGLPQSEIPARTGWTDAEIQETIRSASEAKRIRLILPNRRCSFRHAVR